MELVESIYKSVWINWCRSHKMPKRLALIAWDADEERCMSVLKNAQANGQELSL